MLKLISNIEALLHLPHVMKSHTTKRRKAQRSMSCKSITGRHSSMKLQLSPLECLFLGNVSIITSELLTRNVMTINLEAVSYYQSELSI